MFAIVFVVLYAAAITASTLAWLTGRLAVVWHNGLMTVVNAVCLVVSIHLEWTTNSPIAAASTALHAWLWWNGGGGDGTRRRLKSWASRFQGVRRTAPSHA